MVSSSTSALVARLKRVDAFFQERAAFLEREMVDENGYPKALPNEYSKPGTNLCQADLKLMKQLCEAEENVCLTDPTLPDSPITLVSPAFLEMTGYRTNECVGRNWRFLYGTHTDFRHLNGIREAVQEGTDFTVCIKNYRKDGTPFYNRFIVTPLRDTSGRIKHFLGVHCQVSQKLASIVNEKLGLSTPEPGTQVKAPATGRLQRRRASIGAMERLSHRTQEEEAFRKAEDSVIPWYDLHISLDSLPATRRPTESETRKPQRRRASILALSPTNDKPTASVKKEEKYSKTKAKRRASMGATPLALPSPPSTKKKTTTTSSTSKKTKRKESDKIESTSKSKSSSLSSYCKERKGRTHHRRASTGMVSPDALPKSPNSRPRKRRVEAKPLKHVCANPVEG